jgi:hypothetical protein
MINKPDLKQNKGFEIETTLYTLPQYIAHFRPMVANVLGYQSQFIASVTQVQKTMEIVRALLK